MSTIVVGLAGVALIVIILYLFRAKIESDPDLNHYEVDLGSASDGTLEIWVNDLPDNKLKRAFRETVTKWNKKTKIWLYNI